MSRAHAVTIWLEDNPGRKPLLPFRGEGSSLGVALQRAARKLAAVVTPGTTYTARIEVHR